MTSHELLPKPLCHSMGPSYPGDEDTCLDFFLFFLSVSIPDLGLMC